MKKRQMTDRLQGMAEDDSVAHVYRIEPNGRPCVAWDNASEIKVGAKLYAAPPKRDLTCVCGAVWEGEQMVHAPRKREWVGLTDEEVSYCRYAATFCDELDTAYMAELIEQALKEKNT
jgi:hypothetical protein